MAEARHLVTLDVEGRPATLATGSDVAWKDAVRQAVNKSGAEPHAAGRFRVHVEFRTATTGIGNERWDIDNLVASTLDAMEGVLGPHVGNGGSEAAADRVDHLEVVRRSVRTGEAPGAQIQVWLLGASAGATDSLDVLPSSRRLEESLMPAPADTGLDPVAVASPLEDRVSRLERTFDLLRSPVVHDKPVLPPVGVLSDFSDGISDPAVAKRAARDWLPIPPPENREGYAANNHLHYWLTGLEDYDKVKRGLEWRSVDGGRLFDFGGSTGRVFRHFYCQDRSFEVWTSDFKISSYQWNQRYMPSEIRLLMNGFYPCLPMPDRYFDIITAFSVFTHIDELESAWLLELRRILRPGGLLYLTIHDDAYWQQKSDTVLAAIRRSPNGADITAESPFPAERTAYHFSDESYYSCNVFHPHEYVQREWGRFFEILDISPKGHFGQCVVMLTYD